MQPFAAGKQPGRAGGLRVEGEAGVRWLLRLDPNVNGLLGGCGACGRHKGKKQRAEDESQKGMFAKWRH
jgi:hypothetical protein